MAEMQKIAFPPFFMLFAAAFYEFYEQRLRFVRAAFEFRVELYAHKEFFLRKLHSFDYISVGAFSISESSTASTSSSSGEVPLITSPACSICFLYSLLNS